MANTKKWSDYRNKYLSDPENVKGYLETAFEEFQSDDNRAALLLTLRNIAEAQGGIARLAKEIPK